MVRDKDRTKAQLISELAELRQRIHDLEAAEADRVRLEELLREERNLLRTLIDTVPEYVFVKDVQARMVLNNAAHLRVLGATTQEEVVGKTDFDFFPEEFAAKYYADDQAVIRSGQPIATEEFFIDETGETRWASVIKTPLRNSRGDTVGLVGLNRASISRALVGQMLRDLASIGGLSEGAMFQAGQELAARVDAKTLPEYLDAFAGMGLGALGLAEGDEDRQRWTFTGEGLMLRQSKSEQPTCHYCRGYLCGAVAGVTAAPRVVSAEVACQSMGDDLCRFVVQVVE